MNRRELEPADIPFWQLDEALGELELMERPSGPALYTVQLKARTGTASYDPSQRFYPLQHSGTEHELWGKAYILVTDVTLTVGLYSTPRPSGAIGQVTDSKWQGMRHHEIANVRGLYFEDDRALAIWEVDAWGRLDEFTHGRLWQLLESFLVTRFPAATRIFTDDAEPTKDTRRNREFLRALRYEHVSGTNRVFAKEVRR